MIAFYNTEVQRLTSELRQVPTTQRTTYLRAALNRSPDRIKWTSSLEAEVRRGTQLHFDSNRAVIACYRPFQKAWVYYAPKLTHRMGKFGHFFPTPDAQNLVIMVKQRWSGEGHLALMVDAIPDLQSDGGAQNFPLYVYDTDDTDPTDDTDTGADPTEPEDTADADTDKPDPTAAPAPAPRPAPVQAPLFAPRGPTQATLFPPPSPAASPRFPPPPERAPVAAEPAPRASAVYAPPRAPAPPRRRDAITDAGLAHFQTFYPAEPITKEDLFYYTYGILHSPEYRARYADNLGKELPRIPRVKSASDFRAFVAAGRALGGLHVGYETVREYPATIEGPAAPTAAQLRVEKMKFGKGKDKSVIHYNAFFTVRDIPLAAYGYVVNGKPAIEWVMERQAVTTDKDSGIVKDANLWATETMGDPRYPLSLLLRVITVSLETQAIVAGLPPLVIEGD